MIRMRVNRRRDPHDLGLISGVDRDDTGDARTPFSNCASFIDSESIELSDCFKKCAAFDEHAAAGHRRQARNNRYRSRDYQRTRASDNQQHQAAVKPDAPRCTKNYWWEEEN